MQHQRPQVRMSRWFQSEQVMNFPLVPGGSRQQIRQRWKLQRQFGVDPAGQQRKTAFFGFKQQIQHIISIQAALVIGKHRPQRQATGLGNGVRGSAQTGDRRLFHFHPRPPPPTITTAARNSASSQTGT